MTTQPEPDQTPRSSLTNDNDNDDDENVNPYPSPSQSSSSPPSSLTFDEDLQKPEIRFINNSKFGKFILEKCPIVDEKFIPTWWASSSFLQTVVPSIMRSRQDTLRFTREIINCPDGGVVSLDWFEGSPSSADTPIAVIFPGLVGDSQSEYLRYIVSSLKNIGYRAVVFNNRGRGGLELRTPRLYCAANFEDMELALNSLRDKNPNSLIVASGFSMGGMVLTRYLADRGHEAKVDAAMLISANYDLVNGTKHMETGFFNKFIARIMTKELTNVILSDKEVLARTDKPVQWDKLKEATSFRELDACFTCPMWGYSDPDEYFRDSTNNERLPNIKVPTLALNAADDMFSPYATLPLDKVNDAFVFVITQRGGHLGFMDGWRPSVPYYGDKLIEQYHKAMLGVDRPRDLLVPTGESSSDQ